jgi:hypothetical protein
VGQLTRPSMTKRLRQHGPMATGKLPAPQRPSSLKDHSARYAKETRRPLEPGTIVRVYTLGSSSCPCEEGRARIIGCVDPARHLYRVRFMRQPEVVRVRVVIPAWQGRPAEQVLKPLIAHWGANLSRAAFGDFDYGAD